MLAIATAAVFVFLAGLHFYWAAFGTGKNSAAIPEVDGVPAFRPSKAATAAVGLALLSVVAIVLLHVPLLLAGAALVLIARAVGDFRLVGFFKRVKGSKFARMDTLVYSPLCLGLGIALGLLAAS